MKKYFPSSELIINEDGSVFHLHVKPEWLADKVILVGDPGRVALVASHFENKECEVESREFKTVTGTYKGKRITVVSTGIGCDNIDIVVNELDALANIDFQTREEKEHLRSLELVRIGTCGGLQPNTPVGTFVCSEKSIGFDGLLNFYAGRNAVCDLPFERAFLNHMGWSGNMCAPAPYVIDANAELIDRIAQEDMVRGVTIAAGGFFGPQGRELRVPLADPKQNDKIEKFEYKGYKITNFEMESSALDFETATGYMESACAVGIVTVTDGEITDEYYSLIQPPENEYWRANMLVHGITPGMTESLPGFHAIYPEVKKRLQGNVVVAHNEQFDRNVLKNTMRMYGLDYDELSLPERWECTCRIYRSLGYKPVNLSACCEREGIELKHHEALSDAWGCAKLYLNFLEKYRPLSTLW